jgi:hypothetical protein
MAPAQIRAQRPSQRLRWRDILGNGFFKGASADPAASEFTLFFNAAGDGSGENFEVKLDRTGAAQLQEDLARFMPK